MKHTILSLKISTAHVKSPKDLNILTRNIYLLEQINSKNKLITKEASNVIRTFSANKFYKIASDLSGVKLKDINSQQSFDESIGGILKEAFLADMRRGLGGIISTPFKWLKDKGSRLRVNKEIHTFIDVLEKQVNQLKSLQKSNPEQAEEFGENLMNQTRDYTRKKFREYRLLSKTNNNHLYNVTAPFARLYSLWDKKTDSGQFPALQRLVGLLNSIKEVWLEADKGSSFSGSATPDLARKIQKHHLSPEALAKLQQLPEQLQEVVLNTSDYSFSKEKAITTIDRIFPGINDAQSLIIFEVLTEIYGNKTKN